MYGNLKNKASNMPNMELFLKKLYILGKVYPSMHLFYYKYEPLVHFRQLEAYFWHSKQFYWTHFSSNLVFLYVSVPKISPVF